MSLKQMSLKQLLVVLAAFGALGSAGVSAQTVVPAAPTLPGTVPSTQVSATPVDPNLPSYTAMPASVPAAPVIPTPPVAPTTSRLYAGAGAAFGSNSAYGIVIGSTQVFSRFGAQVGVEYSAKTGAMLVDALLTFRPQLGLGIAGGKLRPYAGVGVGLSSSTPVTGTTTTVNGVTTTNSSVTDYTAQALLGSDYLFSNDIALYGEAGYRHAFSSKGEANGDGGLARLGIKFFF